MASHDGRPSALTWKNTSWDCSGRIFSAWITGVSERPTGNHREKNYAATSCLLPLKEHSRKKSAKRDWCSADGDKFKGCRKWWLMAGIWKFSSVLFISWPHLLRGDAKASSTCFGTFHCWAVNHTTTHVRELYSWGVPKKTTQDNLETETGNDPFNTFSCNHGNLIGLCESLPWT